MAGQKFTLTFDAQLEVSQMKSALGEIQKSLNSLNLPQNVTKDLMGTFQKLTDEIRNFENLSSKGIAKASDMSALEKSSEKILNFYNLLQIKIKDLGSLSGQELNKLFPSQVVDQINAGINALKKYEAELKAIQDKVNKANSDLTQKKNEQAILVQQRQQTQQTLQILQKQEASYKRLRDQSDKTLTTLKAKAQSLEQIMASVGVKANVAQNIKDFKDLENALDNAREKQQKYNEEVANGTRKGNKITEAGLQKRINELEAVQAAWGKQQKPINYAEAALSKYSTKAQETGAAIKNVIATLTKLETKINNASTNIKVAEAAFKQLKNTTGTDTAKAIDNLFKTLESAGFNIQGYGRTVDEARRALKDFEVAQQQVALNGVQKAMNAIQAQSSVIEDNRRKVDECTQAWKQFNNQEQEINMLKSRIQYFFGLNNAIQLVKRTMREAYETIKELDKAMTETAVVTDFSVSDMWAQLPEYTKRANELGVSTKAAYEAATLYYQQGLKTNEVMAMSNETLKMARIAGLDAAVATDRMTNAIRGFNMEINTANAQRIDDVYSKLAAISASNVDEISTAMTKVASLAHNANMEFETTAAFLAQIIETTRESAETAGTALKTVVARFSEVKKLVGEGELSGSDEEGELINVNKVSSALRVAGIDLNKYFLGQVGLDDIFMELASKWNQLTTLQQRYIATQAAGSRQQSRFIALMSDYARTQELVGEAYNANGAAAKQFEKTQESLESKLARLKNAWDEFAMGVLNNDLVKIGVDLLTDLLNGVNALTSGFDTLNSGVGSFINTFAKLVLLIGGLKVGKGLTAGLFGSMLSAVTGGKVGGGFVNLAAGAMGVNPGKNLLTTLGAGAINPFKNIANGIGGGLQSLGATKTLMAMDGSKALSARLAGSIFGKLTGAGMAEGGALGFAGAASMIPVLGKIALAAGVAYVAIKKLYDISPAGQVKIAEKYANSLNKVADATRSSQREFKSIQEEYNRLETNVQQATTTEERTEAIKSRTEYIQSLLEQNAAYAQYIDQYEVKNGEIFLTLDSDKLAEACKKIAETALKVQSGVDIANANVAFQQYQKAQSDVEQLEELIEEAENARKEYYGDSDEETKRWREDRNIDGLEADLVSAQSKMLAFQKEYESFANLGVTKYLTGIEKTTLGKDLTDESRTFAAAASKYSFNGDDIQKRITEETTRFFGLVSKETLGTLDGARDAFIKQFKTSIIPEDLKNDEKGLIDAVAFDKAIEEILGPVSDSLANGFLDLSKEYQDILLDLMITGGENLKYSTTTSITNNLPKALDGIWGSFDEKLQQKLIESSANIDLFSTINEILSKNFKPNSDEYTKLLQTIYQQFVVPFDLTNKQTETISNIFTKFAKDNYNSFEPFSEFINSLISVVSKTGNPDDLINFFGALATLDTDSASSIDSFFSLLDGLEINFTEVKGSAKAAAEYLKELANTKNPFDIESLKTKVDDAISTIWDIRERKSTQQGYRTFSESEYKIIEDAVNALGPSAGIDLNNFKRTGIKNKEWNYVGGDLEELVQLLVQDLNKAIEQAKDYLTNPADQLEIDRATQSVDYLTAINQLPNRPGMNFERYQSAVEGKFAVDEHAEDRYEDILKSIKGLSAAYKQLGIDEKEQEIIAKALAVNWSQQASKLTELTEVLDKNDKILYESSKDSYEYSGAIHAVGEAMRAAYGEQVTDEFVQAHIQQIMLARESEQAYQELLNLLQQDFFSNAINGGNEFQQQLYALQQEMFKCGATASQLDGLELNGVAILDGTPWMNVIKQLGDNLEAFEAYLATCGWTLVLSEDKDPLTGLPLHASLVRNQPTGYGGYQPYTGNNWGRGSSAPKEVKEQEPKKEEWRSDFDWLYNLMEDITELQREQTKLQEEQNKILESNNREDTGKDLYENLVKQIANLTIQREYQSTVQSYRRREMQEFMAVNAGYGGYFRFNDQDQTLEIDWDAINNIGDKETYEKVKQLVSEAEAIQKKMDESEDAIRSVETQIRQLENIWREQYANFEKRVLEAFVKSQQKVIDNYSDLSETITQTNEDILDALQKEIALERQIRDNTKTEKRISNTESRLAFLRRDTTGGNEVQILAAQQQLEEERQQYEDTLIDQSISRLQDDNNAAAEQRQKQIELMQAQLDYAAENGEFNDEVYELISSALGVDGELLTDSSLYNLLREEESWDAMSDASKEIWEDELNNTFKEVSAYLLREKSEADGSFAAAIQNQIAESAIQLGSAIAGSVSQAMEHINYIYDDSNSSSQNTSYQPSYTSSTQSNSNRSNQNGWVTEDVYDPAQKRSINITYNTNNPEVMEWIRQIRAGVYNWGADPGKFRYATGGLNTKTGPAWLDGTPSEPEYVLNARQTEAFLKLADVLPSIFDRGSISNNNTNSTMYLNFDINVESISDDYDVDRLVERVKDDIYNAASYRNANVINLSR